MTLQYLNNLYVGKRIHIKSKRDNIIHSGLVSYFTYTHIPSHGLTVYFGRKPIFRVDPLSISIYII